MTLGPFLRRELATSARGPRASSDRRVAVILAGSTVLGCCLLWDQQGWDRSSILGAHRFGLAVFGLMVAGMMLLALGVVVHHGASAIASERDRKSLDALLASRFSSLEIVLGAMAGGLFHCANALVATLPVVILMVYLGGVAPTWAVLGGVGLASTACLLAGFAVAASAGAKTASRAMAFAIGWFGAWFALPPLYLISRVLGWSGAPSWLTSAFELALDSSPMGLLMNLLGLAPRPGGAVEAVGRMAAWQLAWTLVLIAWATARLRPASRALYDVEGERGRIKRLKAALRRPPRRPPCSDDPVYWWAVHTTRRIGPALRLAGGAIGLAWLAALAFGTWHFAKPAFAELTARGYGPSPEAFTVPELHPLMRLIIKARLPTLAPDANPGQARLEFNMVLRLFSALFSLMFAASAFSAAFEGIKGERRRDTWIGLLATPLTPREILRGKAFGAIRRSRGLALTLVATWTVGLLVGAVHPLGYLGSIALLAASGGFAASLGLMIALFECSAENRGRATLPFAQTSAILGGVLLMTAGPMSLAWAGLLTYEDVAAAVRSAPFPELREGPVAGWLGARGILLAWLAGAGALAFGASWLGRANERGFDAAVGRPIRPEGHPST